MFQLGNGFVLIFALGFLFGAIARRYKNDYPSGIMALIIVGCFFAISLDVADFASKRNADEYLPGFFVGLFLGIIVAMIGHTTYLLYHKVHRKRRIS